MNRRDSVLALVALGAAPLIALAQHEKRVRRVGVFLLASAKSSSPWLAAFREGMTQLGWEEGRNYVIEARYGDGVAQAGPVLAGSCGQ